MQEVMRKAPNVTKIFLVSIFILQVACKAMRRPDVVDNTYTFKRYISKTGFSSINVKAYDHEYKSDLNASVSINHIYHKIKFNKKKTTPLHVEVIPNKNFNVEVFLLSRHTVKVKEFFVKRGDSIVINAYLKEDNRPVY